MQFRIKRQSLMAVISTALFIGLPEVLATRETGDRNYINRDNDLYNGTEGFDQWHNNRTLVEASIDRQRQQIEQYQQMRQPKQYEQQSQLREPPSIEDGRSAFRSVPRPCLENSQQYNKIDYSAYSPDASFWGLPSQSIQQNTEAEKDMPWMASPQQQQLPWHKDIHPSKQQLPPQQSSTIPSLYSHRPSNRTYRPNYSLEPSMRPHNSAYQSSHSSRQQNTSYQIPSRTLPQPPVPYHHNISQMNQTMQQPGYQRQSIHRPIPQQPVQQKIPQLDYQQQMRQSSYQRQQMQQTAPQQPQQTVLQQSMQQTIPQQPIQQIISQSLHQPPQPQQPQTIPQPQQPPQPQTIPQQLRRQSIYYDDMPQLQPMQPQQSMPQIQQSTYYNDMPQLQEELHQPDYSMQETPWQQSYQMQPPPDYQIPPVEQAIPDIRSSIDLSETRSNASDKDNEAPSQISDDSSNKTIIIEEESISISPPVSYVSTSTTKRPTEQTCPLEPKKPNICNTIDAAIQTDHDLSYADNEAKILLIEMLLTYLKSEPIPSAENTIRNIANNLLRIQPEQNLTTNNTTENNNSQQEEQPSQIEEALSLLTNTLPKEQERVNIERQTAPRKESNPIQSSSMLLNKSSSQSTNQKKQESLRNTTKKTPSLAFKEAMDKICNSDNTSESTSSSDTTFNEELNPTTSKIHYTRHMKKKLEQQAKAQQTKEQEAKDEEEEDHLDPFTKEIDLNDLFAQKEKYPTIIELENHLQLNQLKILLQILKGIFQYNSNQKLTRISQLRNQRISISELCLKDKVDPAYLEYFKQDDNLESTCSSPIFKTVYNDILIDKNNRILIVNCSDIEKVLFFKPEPNYSLCVIVPSLKLITLQIKLTLVLLKGTYKSIVIWICPFTDKHLKTIESMDVPEYKECLSFIKNPYRRPEDSYLGVYNVKRHLLDNILLGNSKVIEIWVDDFSSSLSKLPKLQPTEDITYFGLRKTDKLSGAFPMALFVFSPRKNNQVIHNLALVNPSYTSQSMIPTSTELILGVTNTLEITYNIWLLLSNRRYNTDTSIVQAKILMMHSSKQIVNERKNKYIRPSESSNTPTDTTMNTLQNTEDLHLEKINKVLTSTKLIYANLENICFYTPEEHWKQTLDYMNKVSISKEYFPMLKTILIISNTDPLCSLKYPIILDFTTPSTNTVKNYSVNSTTDPMTLELNI
ncbi:hypothetical protein NEOKW01_0437 [Nematocida sp. AWRm80]|nr:hypothetical protein NEOKW01_0437 [Nematocida sp. AWRm80]